MFNMTTKFLQDIGRSPLAPIWQASSHPTHPNISSNSNPTHLRHPGTLPAAERRRVCRGQTRTPSRRVWRARVTTVMSPTTSHSSSSSTILGKLRHNCAISIRFQQNFPPNQRRLGNVERKFHRPAGQLLLAEHFRIAVAGVEVRVRRTALRLLRHHLQTGAARHHQFQDFERLLPVGTLFEGGKVALCW